MFLIRLSFSPITNLVIFCERTSSLCFFVADRSAKDTPVASVAPMPSTTGLGDKLGLGLPSAGGSASTRTYTRTLMLYSTYEYCTSKLKIDILRTVHNCTVRKFVLYLPIRVYYKTQGTELQSTLCSTRFD